MTVLAYRDCWSTGADFGAKFTQEIMKTPEHSIAVPDDTCGNLTQLIQLA
jgi:hypothetical protein